MDVWGCDAKVRGNPHFDEYYKGQNVLDAEEWSAFNKALVSNLPATFRLTETCRFADRLQQQLQTEFQFEKGSVVIDGQVVDPPKQLSWFPSGRAWQLGCARNVLRKTDILKKMHRFLIQVKISHTILCIKIAQTTS